MQSKQVNILVLTTNNTLSNALSGIFKNNENFCVFTDDSYNIDRSNYKWHTIDILLFELDIIDQRNTQLIKSIQQRRPNLQIVIIDYYNIDEFNLELKHQKKSFNIPVNRSMEEISRTIISILGDNFSLKKLSNPE